MTGKRDRLHHAAMTAHGASDEASASAE